MTTEDVAGARIHNILSGMRGTITRNSAGGRDRLASPIRKGCLLQERTVAPLLPLYS